jgi:hypothetical protein
MMMQQARRRMFGAKTEALGVGFALHDMAFWIVDKALLRHA